MYSTHHLLRSTVRDLPYRVLTLSLSFNIFHRDSSAAIKPVVVAFIQRYTQQIFKFLIKLRVDGIILSEM